MPMRVSIAYALPSATGTVAVFMKMAPYEVAFPGSGADSGLWFAGGVLGPVLLCWWADVGAERRIRTRQQPYLPQMHGALGVGAGQPFTIGAERYPVYAVQRTGFEGRTDGLAGDRVPQLHGAAGASAGQQLDVCPQRDVEKTGIETRLGAERRAGRPDGDRVPQPH